MAAIDWIVIAGYFALLMGLAWWVIRKRQDTADDYFLAGRHLGWFIVGASIFASNIGSEHLVGLAGSGTSDGVAMAHYELHAWCLLVLGWVFVPFFMRSKVFTMPEFLERRFSPASRWVLSVISLVAYVVTKIAVGIFAGGIVFGVLLPELRIGPFDSFWIGSFLVIVLTGVYTILGGLRAVAYTEALQSFILVIGSALVTWFGLEALGGWSELKATVGSEMFNLWKPLVPEGVEGTWAPIEERDASGEVVKQAWYFNTNYPWLGMLFCAPIIGLWYWCTDQYIVQRALGARDETQARRGSIFAGLLKLLPVFIFIIPGLICFALMIKGQCDTRSGLDFTRMQDIQRYLEAPDMVARYPSLVSTREVERDGASVDVVAVDLSKAAGSALEETVRSDVRAMMVSEMFADYPEFVVQEGGHRHIDLEAMAERDPEALAELRSASSGRMDDSGKAFPMMVMNVLPAGVRGIVVAGLLAALMSSLAGVFTASATLFTMDFYSKLRPGVSQRRLVWIGRVATAAMALIGIAWIPVIQGSRGLYDYLQSVQGYLAPPIFVVFFLGVFWKRLNGAGCLWALSIGFVMGIFRMAVDTPPKVMSAFEYHEGSFLWIVHKMYFQYYSLLVFLVCCVVMVVVSYLTAPPDYAKISGLTYGTVTDDHRAASRRSFDWRDVALSLMVLVGILAAYLYFNG